MKIFIIIFFIMTSPAWSDEYYFGQYIWNKDCAYAGEMDGCWESPHRNEGLTGSLDLRSVPDEAQHAGDPHGYGIFTYKKPINDTNMIHLGSSKDEVINSDIKEIIAQKMKLATVPDKSTVADVIYQLRVDYSDPTGENAVPTMPLDENGKLNIFLGTEGKIKEVKITPFKSKEWNKILIVLQNEYRKNIKNERRIVTARWLDMLQEQYQIPYNNFIPDDVIKIASLPHHTTATETFTCSDRNLEDGCDLPWTQFFNNGDSTIHYSIVSNKLQNGTALVTNFSENRADSALSSDSHVAQWTLAGGGAALANSFQGLIIHKDNTTDRTFIRCNYTDVAASSSDTWTTVKLVSGTATTLGGTTTQTMVDGDIVKCSYSGGAVSRIVNGTTQDTTTDSTGSGNLYCGVRGVSPHVADTKITSDDWSCADIVAASTMKVINSND